jgi:hypothetical protein
MIHVSIYCDFKIIPPWMKSLISIRLNGKKHNKFQSKNFTFII